MNCLSLFSGIGGLDIAVEHTFGARTVLQVEADQNCRKVLGVHWPNALQYDDVRNVRGKIGTFDIICGGFPCTDLSVAGKQRGISPETRSGLWLEMLRIVQDHMPPYVVIENVPQLLKEPTWSQVRDPLLLAGYGIRYVVLSAADVGAPHLRKRVFVLATKGGKGCERVIVPHPAKPAEGNWPTPVRQDQDGRGRGSSVSRQYCFSLTDRVREPWPPPVHSDKNSRSAGYQQGGQPLTAAVRAWASPAHRDHRSGAGRADNGHSPQLPEQVGGVLNPYWVEQLMGYPAGWTAGLKHCAVDKDWPAARGEPQKPWEHPRTVPARWQDPNSLVTRRPRIGMLGNAVVPQQALYALSLLLVPRKGTN